MDKVPLMRTDVSILFSGGSAVSTQALLDLLVWTDTGRCRSGSKGCIIPVLCEFCGLTLNRCKCRPGVDY